jgi:hypothetical protein
MNLPEPKYTVTDPGNKHKYTISHPERGLIGPLKSVTKIVGVLDKPALVGWAAKEAAGYFKAELLRVGAAALTPEELDRIAAAATGAHRRKAKDAADLGTACHGIFEAIVAGKEPEQIPAELAEPARDFKRWRLSTDIEIVAQELPVGSAMLEFGGRLDVVGYSKARGGFGIVDYKTSSGFYGNEYAYQVGGYALAVEEQYGVPVTWAEIVRFGKKPPFDSEARPVTDLRAAIDAFAVLASIAEHQDAELIGVPSFSTAVARAAEAAQLASNKKKQPAGLGF